MTSLANLKLHVLNVISYLVDRISNHGLSFLNDMDQCLNITNSGFPGGLFCRSRNRGSLCAKKRPCLTIGDVYIQVSPECSNRLINEITLLPHKVLLIESGPPKEF